MLDDTHQDELHSLSLSQLLSREDLVMEEILSIKQIHHKINLDFNLFIDYCVGNPTFTERLLAIGLKCPMHLSNNQTMKNMTQIANQLLTVNDIKLADLFIDPHMLEMNLKWNEIQNDQRSQLWTQIDNLEDQLGWGSDRYKYLKNVVDYLALPQLDENCVNSIVKTLQVVVFYKLNEFLQFFTMNHGRLTKVIQNAHYPSLSNFLAQIITDKSDKLSPAALKVKRKILPLLLTKIQRYILNQQTAQTYDCIHTVLNSSQYSATEQRSQLQQMGDLVVNHKQIIFHVDRLIEALSHKQCKQKQLYQAVNSAHYLSIVVARMNMDEYTFTKNQKFKPTLLYQVDQLFQNFCQLVVLFKKLWIFKASFKETFGYYCSMFFQLLTLMCKHSRFGQFYSKIISIQRLCAIQTLVQIACHFRPKGITLCRVMQVMEKMLGEEQKIAEQSQGLFVADLSSALLSHRHTIAGILDNGNKNNKDEVSIFYWKMLLILNHYFQHKNVQPQQNNIANLQQMFPFFSNRNRTVFAERAIIENHPDGNKAEKVAEFHFIQTTHQIIQCNVSQQQINVSPSQQAAERQDCQSVYTEKTQFEQSTGVDLVVDQNQS